MAASLARRNPKPIDPFAPSAYDDLADGDGPQADGSKSKRLRRPAVKLDEDRLLNNPAGFKKLVELSKIFEPGPKGSEVRALFIAYLSMQHAESDRTPSLDLFYHGMLRKKTSSGS